jgi:hypothetical protein
MVLTGWPGRTVSEGLPRSCGFGGRLAGQAKWICIVFEVLCSEFLPIDRCVVFDR